MANDEFLKICNSTLGNFEQANEITEFNIDNSSSILPDNFNGTRLSFENYKLSFENDDMDKTVSSETEEESIVKDVYSQPKQERLNLSKEDFSKVINWLDNIRGQLGGSHKELRRLCAATKDHVIKKSISYNELYATLEEISKRVKNLY